MKMLDVLQYKIVQGLPLTVEHDVNALLKNGWTLNGEMLTMRTADCRTDIVVQSLVLINKHKKEG